MTYVNMYYSLFSFLAHVFIFSTLLRNIIYATLIIHRDVNFYSYSIIPSPDDRFRDISLLKYATFNHTRHNIIILL